jgi:hypothetical protein
MKTHKVLDLHYLPEEGQDCFSGTLQECEEFVATQTPHFMYKVVPMTTDELRLHPDNQIETKGVESCLEFYRRWQKCNQN